MKKMRGKCLYCGEACLNRYHIKCRHDQYEARRAAEPLPTRTDGHPAKAEAVRVYRERAARGEPLFRADDWWRRGDQGPTGCGSN